VKTTLKRETIAAAKPQKLFKPFQLPFCLSASQPKVNFLDCYHAQIDYFSLAQPLLDVQFWDRRPTATVL